MTAKHNIIGRVSIRNCATRISATTALLCAGVGVLAIGGCKCEMHPIPRNADPTERKAVAVLKPICGNISWNERGRVESIDLTGNRTNDRTLEYVAHLSDLRELGLIGAHITDDGLVVLKKLKKLRALSIQATVISDKGLLHLQENTSLRLIDLGHTQVSDIGLKHLEKLPNLTRLFIGNTKVTDQGVKELQAALPKCVIQRK